ncbi:translation initiation factor IF-3, C-terminal domain-containing protein [Haematococcus lacustris]
MPVAPTMFSKEQYETAGYSPEQLEVAMKDQDKQWQAYQLKYQEYVEAYQKQQAAAASQQVVMYTPEQLYAAGWTQAQVEDRLRQQEIYQQQLLDQQLLQRKQQVANAGRLWDTWYTATNPDNTIARDPNGRPYLMCNEQYYYYNRSPVYSPTGTPLYDNGREMYDAQGYPQPYEPTPVLQPQTYYPDNQMDYPNTQNWTALGRQARGPSSTHMPDEQLEYAEDLIMPAAREPQAKIPRLCYVNGKPVEDNESSLAAARCPVGMSTLVHGMWHCRNWREVRVLADEGGKEMLGTMSLEQATIMAQERGTDVIVLNPDLSTPLVRLWEWSKFKYEAEKDAKQKASKSTVVETKEVQLRPKTDSNDLATKMKSAIKFLEKGKKVRLVMKLEGRELQFRDSSKEVLMKFLADVEQVGKPEVDVNYKGGSYTVVLCPTGKNCRLKAAELPAPGGVAGAGQGTPSVVAAELAAEVESPAGSQNGQHLPSELPAATRAPEQRLEVAVAGVQALQQEEQWRRRRAQC